MISVQGVAKAAVMAAALALLAAGVASADTSTGLVAYLPFSGNALDVTGNGYNGTVYGATLTTDRLGNANSAYYFDGNDDHIELAQNFNFLSMTEGVTVSAWVKSESTNAFIFHQANGGELYLLASDNKGRMVVHGADGSYADAMDDDALPASYINVTGVYYPGDRVEVWVGGVLQNTATATDAGIFDVTWGSYFYANIGAYHERGHGLLAPFRGSIDEFRVYSRALSGDDIRELSDPNPVTAIPEPVTMAGMVLGIGGLVGYIRRRIAR